MHGTGASAEDVLEALARQAPPPLDGFYRQMHPAHREPSWGGYYRRSYHGLTIYGHVMTKDALREEELAAGANPAQADATVATVTEAYPRGWRYGRCYSTAVPEGEMGAAHGSTCTPITESEFEAARARGWQPS